MAREFGPQGLHVAHIIIDGVINGDRIKGFVPQIAERLGDEGMLNIDAIAESFWQVHVQDRTAWTHELDLRPFKENW